VELAPDQVLEESGTVAELVDVVEFGWCDLADPGFLVQAIQRLVFKEQVELDIREPISLAEREGAVHQCGYHALVSLAERSDLLDHDLLLKHVIPLVGGVFGNGTALGCRTKV
jgi:hypothetical protein